MAITVGVADHALLEVSAFVTRFPFPLSQIASTLDPAAPAPAGLTVDEAVRTKVRDLLRAGGFKPAGRSKPASEYLVGAMAEGRFPRINAAVDACNIVSLHSGLPISLVDVDKLEGALRIAVAPAGTTYVFNPSGQVIDASGLVCLWDAVGPTGTPVKDAQRTKTHDGTRAALSIVWGTRALPGRTTAATRWYRELCAAIPGAVIEDVQLP
jgi:DNA/RNA-binding domain of Phe-tRNA-synthetase-like protein